MKVTSNEKVTSKVKTIETTTEKVFNLELSGKEFFVLTSFCGSNSIGGEHGGIIDKIFQTMLHEGVCWSSALFDSDRQAKLEDYKENWEKLSNVMVEMVKDETN